MELVQILDFMRPSLIVVPIGGLWCIPIGIWMAMGEEKNNES